MSFFRPARLTFAWRVRGPRSCVRQRAGPRCEALATPWVVVTQADWHGSEVTREQGRAAALSWRWLREVLAGPAAEAKMTS